MRISKRGCWASRLVGTALWLALLPAAYGAPAVEALALMRDRAILRIDGEQRTLRVGESIDGVQLIEANPRAGVVEIDGRRHPITLSARIAGTFAERERHEVTISRNALHQYRTTVGINGRALIALVDTGATVVALNSAHAARLGLDYQRVGLPSRVETAGGIRNSWHVQLDTVAVGGLSARYVPAVVVEGEFPTDVLLGMSFLQHVALKEANGVMVLSEK